MISSIRWCSIRTARSASPGLMAAYRAGNITIANAPGAGIADDKAVYSFMPEIVRYYMDEEPLLPNVETWRCREPDALAYALDNLGKMVVKLVDGSGGYGMLVGPTATKREDREVPRCAGCRAAPLHRPADPCAVDRADPHRRRHCTSPRRLPAVRESMLLLHGWRIGEDQAVLGAAPWLELTTSDPFSSATR